MNFRHLKKQYKIGQLALIYIGPGILKAIKMVNSWDFISLLCGNSLVLRIFNRTHMGLEQSRFSLVARSESLMNFLLSIFKIIVNFCNLLAIYEKQADGERQFLLEVSTSNCCYCICKCTL